MATEGDDVAKRNDEGASTSTSTSRADIPIQKVLYPCFLVFLLRVETVCFLNRNMLGVIHVAVFRALITEDEWGFCCLSTVP
ncbi:hypothetical protein L6164_009793 [Bauhinia variegata]|uniref:Uncharacterized protein n=1 Tax=Bauhinia variegata TaxID=167791 RepID=A0ACB9PL90_BAUVA|nr:hypothetical protein L6164_009793 [Bauhinia variegata]